MWSICVSSTLYDESIVRTCKHGDPDNGMIDSHLDLFNEKWMSNFFLLQLCPDPFPDIDLCMLQRRQGESEFD